MQPIYLQTTQTKILERLECHPLDFVNACNKLQEIFNLVSFKFIPALNILTKSVLRILVVMLLVLMVCVVQGADEQPSNNVITEQKLIVLH